MVFYSEFQKLTFTGPKDLQDSKSTNQDLWRCLITVHDENKVLKTIEIFVEPCQLPSTENSFFSHCDLGVVQVFYDTSLMCPCI